MKKYNRMILLSVFLYLLFALGAGRWIWKMEVQQDQYYNVEINRIYSGLSEKTISDGLDLHSYKYVKQVTYLPISEMDDKERVQKFYQKENRLKAEIKPWYKADQILGYIRFEYEADEAGMKRLIVIVEGILAGMEMVLLSTLLYLKNRLIKPFHRMSRVPEELAKGRLRAEVKEEKSKYFGQFMWGMGQLKDNLELTRRRTLELEKEKKEMLLSLSHDIKTPLNTIKLYGKALEEDVYQEEAEKKHAARQIGTKTAEIERYVEEIIKNSREDILDIQVENQEFYLADMMDNILDTYKEKCAVRMTELVVESFENCLLQGDMNRAQEVFENIFENAFKYGDGRRIEITFYEEDYCRLIRVFNTGLPVTDNEFNHIFESFFRGGNSEGKQGSGLGLYICRQIMRKMDGEIFAQKEEGGMGFILVFR